MNDLLKLCGALAHVQEAQVSCEKFHGNSDFLKGVVAECDDMKLAIADAIAQNVRLERKKRHHNSHH